MSDYAKPQTGKPSLFKHPVATGRRPVVVSAESLVKTRALRPSQPLPLVFEPAFEGMNLSAWLDDNRGLVERELAARGGVLFRGFGVASAEDFERLLRNFFGDLLGYSYRSTPRTRVSGNVYTSTEYPSDQHIPLHNERSYSTTWPMKIAFFCMKAAEEGGETPIVDSRRIYQRLDRRISARFAEKGVMYIRNYGGGLDLPWQEVFETDDRAVVEGYCRGAGISFEWGGGDSLRTRQVCQAVARHPRTGETVWFNQAHLFHVSSLSASVRETFAAEFAEEELPRHACYGDGSPIEAAALEEIRELYRQESVSFPWRDGDLLLLDNMLAAHGRTPFKGARSVLVGMADLYNPQAA